MSDTVQTISAALQGRYELQSPLGEGGFGTVYKARQSATGQSVAIKVLRLPDGDRAAQAEERRIARFHREMQLCGQMHHPNIVRLVDSGQADGGVVYSVFEFLPGKNLAEVLATEGRLDPSEARHLMIQVLDALACAHGAGVVHRDLKPANIMIVPTGARRNAVVLDFGIGALTQEARLEGEARITQTHESVGTPSYAAPEQLRGQPSTARSDLYAWGLVFLECLTGKRVIEGATAAEVILKQVSADPIPIPPAIAEHPVGALLRRVTAKDPAAREATAESLLRELEACDVSGLRVTSGHVRIQPSPSDAKTATIAMTSAAPAAPSQRLVEGERRQITALCCNLTATGAGPKAADIEELDHVLGLQQEACAEIAQRFGGHVAGALGDAVLFYFGYPSAREDDARRAARAALAMVEEMARRSAALAAERKVRVELRAGIHTGLVVARELREPATSGLGYVVGSTPKLAARLSALAEPGGVLVSGGTQRLLRKQLLLEETGIRVADDATTPVEVFTLHAGDPTTGLSQVPLVGRARELDALLERWARARGGAGQAVLIGGEPGIGKSRLARELRDQLAAEPHTWLECRCTPEGTNSAFHPVVELLDRLLDPRREASAEEKARKLEELLSLYGFELAEAMPLFAPLLSLALPPRWAPLDVSPQKQRELLRVAVLSLLFEMAEKQPVVLLVEDLHWADPSTMELVAQLVAEVGSARVLALFAARPELAPPWPASAVLHLRIERLGRAEVEQLAMRVTGGRPLPAEVLAALAERTDGVPLFVEELLLTMIGGGALVEREGGYALAGPLAGLSIPGTLRDLLVARLDRLGRAKETAQIAAAIGRELSFELLRAVSPLGEAEVQEDLDRLVAAELLQRKRRLRNPTYLFRHALVRDAAYDSMLKRSRREVHARIAKALEERFPETVSERPELLAHHHAEAEQKREAFGYLLKAAVGGLQRSSYREALSQVGIGLSWLDAIDDEQQRAEAELTLNGVLIPLLMLSEGYGSPRLVAAAGRSLEIIDTIGESPLTFPSLWANSSYYHVRGERESALTLAERLVETAERGGDVGQQAMARSSLGSCLWIDGRPEEARAQLERGIALYDTTAHRTLSYAYGFDPKAGCHMFLGAALWFLGYPDQALAQVELAMQWSRELRNASNLGLALIYTAMIRHLRQERQEALAASEQLLELAERHGLGFLNVYAAVFRGWATRQVEDASRILARHEETGQLLGISYYRSLLAEAEMALGRYDDALRRIDGCLELVRDTGERYYLAELLRLKGLCLLAQGGAAQRSEECFLEAIAIAQSQKAKMPELQATVALCRLWKERGRTEEARDRLTAVAGWFEEGAGTAALSAAQELMQELRA
ncbi:TOMM system kinase/cyclase fusion protein [Sorangium sp. So ce385]|uniref:TOMM system kinase/cyclase fusion protein n=1 Tax=Sorangium sp. So ce385 TaxID=3133308 RepID=UPI003F5AEB3C